MINLPRDKTLFQLAQIKYKIDRMNYMSKSKVMFILLSILVQTIVFSQTLELSFDVKVYKKKEGAGQCL